MISRRALFGGLIGLAAPAIIRTPGLLMSIKPQRLEYRTFEIGYSIQADGRLIDFSQQSPESREAMSRWLFACMQSTKGDTDTQSLLHAA